MRRPKWISSRATIPLLIGAVLAAGCDFDAGTQDDEESSGLPSGDADSDGDADTETEDETDTDSASDSSCESCDGEVCFREIEGEMFYDDGTPAADMDSAIKFHANYCIILPTDGEGVYARDLERCLAPVGQMFIEVPPIGSMRDDITRYSSELVFTQEQVSDRGEDDFTLEIGPQYFYRLPDESVPYTPEKGASVGLAGVSYDIEPGQLGEEDLELGVFDFPLDGWIPPFINSPFARNAVDRVDALYYLTPYWQKVVDGDGVVLKIEPPPGWESTDTGKVYMLGDWIFEYLELPGQGEIPVGNFVEVGPTTFEDGKVVTPPLPVLGWVGLRKDTDG